MSDKQPEAEVSRKMCEAILAAPLANQTPRREIRKLAATHISLFDSHEQTITEAVAKERERCLRHAMEHEDHGEFSCGGGRYGCADSIAAAIRSGK